MDSVDNKVVSLFDRTPKKPEVLSDETKAFFDEVAAKNAARKEKLDRERQKKNVEVLKSYRIKT